MLLLNVFIIVPIAIFALNCHFLLPKLCSFRLKLKFYLFAKVRSISRRYNLIPELKKSVSKSYQKTILLSILIYEKNITIFFVQISIFERNFILKLRNLEIGGRLSFFNYWKKMLFYTTLKIPFFIDINWLKTLIV